MWQRRDGSTWKDSKHVLQAPAQIVEKSVGSYLSKYLSKQAPSPQAGMKNALCPVRWWGASRPLLALMRELSTEFKVEGIGVSSIHYLREKLDRYLRQIADGYHSYTDRLGFAQVLVGYGDDAGEIFNLLWRDLRPRTIATAYA